MRGGRQLALAQECQHLRGSHFRQAMHKVLLACGLTGLCEQSGRASHIALGQFQAGKKHLTDNESVNHSIILPRQVEALPPVLLGGIQVVPFIVDTGQAQMCFVDNLKRLISCQLQDAPVGFGRQTKTGFLLPEHCPGQWLPGWW